MRAQLALVLAVFAASSADAQDCASERAAMIETIRKHAAADTVAVGPQGLSDKVLNVMAQVPRHRFVPGRSCTAYADRPAPIGQGQTISQPYIVALMTDLAEVAPEHVALEIGTGSGYQAAVLSPLAKKVCTVEIIQALAANAMLAYRELGYDNVSVRAGDGYHGWPECGPFDVIIVTAALSEVPPPLIEQLKPGGRLVMPVGRPGDVQLLTLVEKSATGAVTSRRVALVRFVPFVRPPN